MLKTLKANPIALLALAGLAGWLLGSGVFALPGMGAAPAPAAPSPAHAPGAGSLPASSSAAAAIATTSASMPSPGLAPDPWSSYDL